MGHDSVHDVSIVVLRSLAKHPIVVILAFDTVFESQREVLLRVFAERNVLDRIKEVRTLRRVGEKTPILFCGKRIQSRTRRVWSRTGWLSVRSLRPPRQRREDEKKGDRHQAPTKHPSISQPHYSWLFQASWHESLRPEVVALCSIHHQAT